LGKHYRVPEGLETCRSLVDRLYREAPVDINLNKSESRALAEFGTAFDRGNPAELGALAGAAGFSMADLDRLTAYLNFKRARV
jgi:hypothetical protein